MQKFFIQIIVALGLFMGAAHADKYDDAMDQYLTALGEFKTAMGPVTDLKSAEAQEPQLTAAVKRFSELKQRLVDIGRPPEERAKVLRETYGPKVNGAMKELFAEMGRLAKIEEVRPVMERVMEHMQ